jgi:hypothetical protein
MVRSGTARVLASTSREFVIASAAKQCHIDRERRLLRRVAPHNDRLLCCWHRQARYSSASIIRLAMALRRRVVLTGV